MRGWCGVCGLLLLPTALLLSLFDLALEARDLPLKVLGATAATPLPTAVVVVVIIVAQVADLGAVPLAPARGAVGPALAGQAVGEIDAARVDLGGQEAGPRLVDAQP